MAIVETSTIISTTLTLSVKYPSYYHQFRIIHNILVKISFPYIFLIASIGFITNTSTIVLLSKHSITKNLKNKWTLIALALSDLLFNIALIIRGIHDIVKGNSDHLCLIISFLSHLAELLSACYTVSFTIQRYLAVRYPFKTAVHRRSSPFISLLFIFILSLIFCFMLSYKNTYVDCHEELQLGWFIADAFISFVIPFSIILIFNILIVNFIRQHSRSPINIQSTLLRKKKKLKTKDRIFHQDDTFDTEKNTRNVSGTYIHTDETQNIEIKFKKEDQLPSLEIKYQQRRPSISLSFNRTHSDKSPNRPHFRSRFRRSGLSKLTSHVYKNPISHSFSYGLSRKSSYQSTDNGFVSTMSTRTNQSIRVSRMLILVSTCFLILNAPAHLFVIALKIYTSIDVPVFNEHIKTDLYQSTRNITISEIVNFVSNNEIHNQTNNTTILSPFQHEGIIEDQITIHLFYMAILLTQLIAYASYSMNFFLYSFCGIAFRTSFKQLINPFRRH
ncbi:unnamed protein product [Rotaria sordida]|uniref:G-protein coupled receptors family 1 profile domain-containing protein n=1 Tax=Rotaria sordida TaxID=392033 RepID=A0A819GV69_9BILA|nr:unnamed protein product [Rotaria sordida]